MLSVPWDSEIEFLPRFTVFHQLETALTGRNLLLRRKRYQFLDQQSSMGDGKILENAGNHKLKPRMRRQVRESGSNKKVI